MLLLLIFTEPSVVSRLKLELILSPVRFVLYKKQAWKVVFMLLNEVANQRHKVFRSGLKQKVQWLLSLPHNDLHSVGLRHQHDLIHFEQRDFQFVILGVDLHICLTQGGEL